MQSICLKSSFFPLLLSNLIFTNLFFFSRTFPRLIINRNHEWKLFKHIFSKSCLPNFEYPFFFPFSFWILRSKCPLCPKPPQLWSGNVFRKEIFLKAQANLWQALLALYSSRKHTSSGPNGVRLHTFPAWGMNGKVDKHKAALSKNKKSRGILFPLPSKQPYVTGPSGPADPVQILTPESNCWGWDPDSTTDCVTLSQVLKLSEPVSSSGKGKLVNNSAS